MAAAWRRSKIHRGKADVWVGLESMVAVLVALPAGLRTSSCFLICDANATILPNSVCFSLLSLNNVVNYCQYIRKTEGIQKWEKEQPGRIF